MKFVFNFKYIVKQLIRMIEEKFQGKQGRVFYIVFYFRRCFCFLNISEIFIIISVENINRSFLQGIFKYKRKN